MYFKLALRNVKRQVGNYLIYFATVTILVALMSALNNIIFSKELGAKVESMQSFSATMTAISIFVAVIVAFLLGYATSFMLRLRKREFGTYMTLGMSRKNIIFLFLSEIIIICLIALVLGMLLGIVIYQGILLLASSLMDIEFAFSAYSIKGIVFTIVMVLITFLLSSVTSTIYLKKASINSLLHGSKKVSKGVRFPAIWMFITLISA